MQMIGHDHELVHNVFLLFAIVRQHIYHQIRLFADCETKA